MCEDDAEDNKRRTGRAHDEEDDDEQKMKRMRRGATRIRGVGIVSMHACID